MIDDLNGAYADYMGQHLGIPQDKIASLCLEYYTKYGTTMAGLVVRASLHLQHVLKIALMS